MIGIARMRDAETVIQVDVESTAQGLMALDVPFAVSGAAGAIGPLRARLGSEVLTGAGTLRTIQELEAVAAGAEFLLAPDLNLSIVEAAVRLRFS